MSLETNFVTIALQSFQSEEPRESLTTGAFGYNTIKSGMK